MIDLIITLLIITPILICTLLYVTEYREITAHKKEMQDEWIKYINEPLCENEKKDTESVRLF